MLRWYFTVITRWIGIVVVLFLWQHVDAQEHEPTSPAEASQGGTEGNSRMVVSVKKLLHHLVLFLGVLLTLHPEMMNLMARTK